MSDDAIAEARMQIGERIAELRQSMPRLSPLDLYARMDSIRRLAAQNGMIALECLARNSSQLALVPGHRVAMTCALDHIDDAFACSSEQDTAAILAALAVRLH
jgi:hypothetical protein